MDVITHLMFQDGNAHAAVDHYVELVPDSGIDGKVGDDGPGQLINFRLGGRPYLAFDSPVQHTTGFTASMSTFLLCDSPAEVDRIFAGLSDGGEVLMPVAEYPFDPHYGWCFDRWGVSWQVGVGAPS